MQAGSKFLFAEELTTTITLDHHQRIPLNFLASRKSVPTIQAFPSPADHGPSLEERESTTLSSKQAHLGHFISYDHN